MQKPALIPGSKSSTRRRQITIGRRLSAASAATLAIALAAPALADPAPEATPSTPEAAPATPTGATPADATAPTEKGDIVVNGIKYRDTVLPTRQSSASVYGLDLGVMDTPRNVTLLSTTQLDTLNIKDPRAFSYLTSSAYTDSSFGTPNIPRIRGQYGDVFINGMRYSFTQHGYGMPLNFDSIDNIHITKGPASVIDGAGPGVGGQADFLTKRPSLTRNNYAVSGSLDTTGQRRLVADASLALQPGRLGLLLSYSGEYSDSYFTNHYFRKSALYAALRWEPTEAYRLDFNTEVNYEHFVENGGVNRVSQDLIDHGTYLTGVPTGELYSSTYGGAAIPIGTPGNPYGSVAPYLTVVTLGNPTQLNLRRTIDMTPGTEAHALEYNAQLIQSYQVNDNLTLHNNTFFTYLSSDNHTWYYYDDGNRGSFTIENRLNLNFKSRLPFGGANSSSEVIVGTSFRLAHTNEYLTWNIETPSIFDLTTDSTQWKIPDNILNAYGNVYRIKSGLGKVQYATPGRDSINFGATGDSNVYDGALFLEHHASFSPKLQLLYGGRLDLVQANSRDPVGGATCCYGGTLPERRSTNVYALFQANASLTYRPFEWLSGYFTYDRTQSNNPNGEFGGINLYGQTADKNVLRQTSTLYEVGLKFNLLDNKMFIGSALFDQHRVVPTGVGGTTSTKARLRGAEVELNYQPTRNFFATASYSYLKTTLSSPASFYNYPAEAGEYIDGAGNFAVFAPGQTYEDPGIPKHLFNALANYKMANGFGVRSGVQVTGPIDLTQSGQLDLAASRYVPASVVANGGYYKSPRLPWQYTWNAAVFYDYKSYTLTVSVYNLTDRLNWQSTPPYYGNDFLVRAAPRTVEFRLQAKL